MATAQTGRTGLLLQHPAVPYTAPFLVFVVLLGLSGWLPVPLSWAYAIRTLASFGVLLAFSRQLISWRAKSFFFSALAGIGVFVIWIAPDLMWPGLREHWLFRNSLVGAASSTVSPEVRLEPGFLFFRLFGSVVLVPVIEELFWRGWLMRWIISHEFQKIPIGAYTAAAFWITAILFASEHGPYWDVGLLAGIAYNALGIRQRNLADCIVAHTITNGCLAAYVLAAGQWQYWL